MERKIYTRMIPAATLRVGIMSLSLAAEAGRPGGRPDRRPASAAQPLAVRDAL